MINRAALILRYKQPAIDWINSADPILDDPGITRDDVNRDRAVYLIAEHDAESESAFKQWLNLNHEALFEREIQAWYTDEELWPELTGIDMFHEWFEYEVHSMLVDTVGSVIEDDEF